MDNTCFSSEITRNFNRKHLQDFEDEQTEVKIFTAFYRCI